MTRAVTIPAGEIRFRFSRSGGPGGQNVNRRDTRVEIVFDVESSPSIGPRLRARALARLRHRLDAQGRLRIVASEERTQAANRAKAIDRLRATLAEALRPPPAPRVPTRPSRAAIERRLAAKRMRSERKRRRARPEPE